MYVQTVMLIGFCPCDRTSIQLLCARVRPAQLLGIATVFMEAGDVALFLGDFLSHF